MMLIPFPLPRHGSILCTRVSSADPALCNYAARDPLVAAWVAKDALGNDVKASKWLATHKAGDHSLTQGLKV